MQDSLVTPFGTIAPTTWLAACACLYGWMSSYLALALKEQLLIVTTRL
jgi:hypothetical protein